MAALQLRPKHRTLHNPSLIHLFSTSSTPPEPTSAEQSPTSGSSDPSESQRSLSSYFSDVKQQQQQQHRPASPFSQRNPTIPAKPSSPLDSDFSKPSKLASFEEIRRKLSELRLRSSVPPLSRPNSTHATTPSSESSSQHISFQELCKRNVIEKADENGTKIASGPEKFGGTASEAFQEYFRKLRSSPEMLVDEQRRRMLLIRETMDNLKLEQSTDPVPVIGGTGTLPVSVFGKEREQKDTEGEKMAMKTEFVKMEDKETESRIGGVTHKDLRESLLRLRMSYDEKAKKSSNMDSQDLGHMNSTNLLSQDQQLDPSYGGQSGNSSMTVHDNLPVPHNDPIGVRKSVRGANFTPEEDKLLVSAWLNCSLDAVQGTDQEHSQLWKKNFEYFEQFKETTNDRTIKSLIHRWSVIENATNKFCAKLVKIEGMNKISMTEQGKYEVAKHMYELQEKCSFQFEHCWHLLKDQPKWIRRSTKEDPKRMKTMSPSPTPTRCSGVETVDSVFDLGPNNVIDNDVIELDQPMGGKAEKGKRKAKGMARVETVVLSRLEYTLLVNKIRQEDERLRLEAEKMEIDKEN